MSAAVDANLLLYASNEADERHGRARDVLARCAAGPELLYLFWPVVFAYLRISTHPAVFDHPLSPTEARANLDGLLLRPHIRSPGEGDGFWSVCRRVMPDDTVRGNLVTDAHLVALMQAHGVGAIWTGDRDFRRFDGVEVRDPFT